MRLGWGADNPTFRQVFTGLFIPGATHEQADIFNELQRKTTSPECAVRYFDAVGDFDIIDLLSKVKAPTLVMHVRDDQIVPIEAGPSSPPASPALVLSLCPVETICSWSMSLLPTASSRRSAFS